MAFARVFRRNKYRETAHQLYVQIVEQARQPFLYSRLGVPDTLDGRFEMVVLHAYLVLRRLKTASEAAELAQSVFDTMFADLDRVLREMGTGDLSVGAQVKRMASGFYGRAAAYDGGLDGTGDLQAALRRNVFGTVESRSDDLAALADYVRGQAAALCERPIAEFLAGRAGFSPADVAREAVSPGPSQHAAP
jgi:cytochrome b pre-mRNA-processing protein 3